MSQSGSGEPRSPFVLVVKPKQANQFLVNICKHKFYITNDLYQVEPIAMLRSGIICFEYYKLSSRTGNGGSP